MLGEEVASEEALERRVLEQLQGRGRWGGRDDYTPADGVVHAIRSSPDAGAWFETALLTALDSDDVGVRAGAISALGALRAPSAPALLDALRRSPDRFVDVPFPPERRQSRSLEDALAGLHALGPIYSSFGRGGERLLRHGAVDNTKGAAGLFPNLPTGHHSGDAASPILALPDVLAEGAFAV